MSDLIWDEILHTVPAAHIRGFPRGCRTGSASHLQLSVKQYVPREKYSANEGQITLIAAPGVGQAKELFEPFFKHLLKVSGLPIRAFWSFDPAHFGASYVLNENIIGDEHHWLDASRDLLQIINFLKDEMPPPIYGMGESWGSAVVLMASIFHPRLFAGIIFGEPVFDTGFRFKSHLRSREMEDRHHRALAMAKRSDFWVSKEQASQSLRRAAVYRDFDPEVFELSVAHDLRSSPTPEYPQAVRLKTPKSMAIATMMLPDPPRSEQTLRPESWETNRTTVIPGFHRPEVTQIQYSIPLLWPPALYLWGELSPIGRSDYAAAQVERTGTSESGNGGVTAGQVDSNYISGAGHSILLEKPKEGAIAVGPWLGKRLRQWEKQREVHNREASFNPAKLNPLLIERFERLTKL